MKKFSQWITEVQDQYIDMDGAYGAQCWDLHAHFADTFGLPRINTGHAGRWVGWAGNMYDAYPQTPEIEAAYELVPGTMPAEPGDTVIWDDSYWYYPKTHVAIVIKDGPQLLCMSLNSTPSRADNPYPGWTTGPATIQHLPKGGLLGYLRPRMGVKAQSSTEPAVTTQPNTEEGFLMAMTPESQAALGHNAYLAVDSLGRVERQMVAILETLALVLPAVARIDTRAAEEVDVNGRLEKNQALLIESAAAVEQMVAAKGDA